MKELVGYLLNRETGVGIAGKVVEFTKLDGSPVTAADTYWQNISGGVTDANGMFSGKFELSPGPINTKVTVSGTEVKVRKHNERAEFGFQWASDISRIARGTHGVIGGFLNEMAVSCPSGHTIRIATGAAVFNGSVFSIENTFMDILGTANNNAALTTRVDLLTLRQYNETAAGQDAGRQQVVITEGVANGVAPSLPTGASFVDFPLAEISTAYNAAIKNVSADRRLIRTTPTSAARSSLFFEGGLTAASANLVSGSYATVLSVPMTGLNAGFVYDGIIRVSLPITISATYQGTSGDAHVTSWQLMANWNEPWLLPTLVNDRVLFYRVGDFMPSGAYAGGSQFQRFFHYFEIPINGLTGFTSKNFDLKLRGTASLTGYINGKIEIGGHPTLSEKHVTITLKPRS